MARKWLKAIASLLSSAVVMSSVAIGSLTAEAVEEVEIVPSQQYSYRVTTPTDYIRLMGEASGPKEAKLAREAAREKSSSWDNSSNDNKKYFPAIDNQGSIGSCGAWASIYYTYTYEMNRYMGRDTTDATTFNPLFIFNLYANGGRNNGIFPYKAYEIIAVVGAITKATNNDITGDYKTYHPGEDIWREADNYRLTSCFNFDDVGNSWNQITSADDPDLDAIKTMLRSGHVTTFCGYIFDFDYVQLKAVSGKPEINKDVVGQQSIRFTKNPSAGSFHAMTIVGYNDNIWTDVNKNNKIDDGEMGALKIANSWGPGWNNKGFCWVAYDALNKTSCVPGTDSPATRVATMSYICMPVIKEDFKASHIYLKYTLNSRNRHDSYLMVKATKKSDGSVRKIKTMPQYFITYTEKTVLNYEGTEGYGDGTFILDLDNIVPGLNTDNFNDYNWSVDVVDGSDGYALNVKDLYIVDEQGRKEYPFEQKTFSVNNQTKTVKMRPCYNISYLSYSPKSNVVVNSPVKIAFKTENETRNSSKIVYNMLITRNDKNGKKVYAASTKAAKVDASARTASVNFQWTPKTAGTYLVAISATDAAGNIAVRSTTVKVFPEKLAVRSLNITTTNPISGSYVYNYDTVRLTPKVTGGTAPYTYTYSFTKGGKTYTMAKNTKKSTWAKEMSANAGVYTFKVTVKDSKNQTASLTQNVTVAKTKVYAMDYSVANATPGTAMTIAPHLINVPTKFQSGKTYQYTITDTSGKVSLQVTSNNSVARWTPSVSGDHKVNLKVTCNDKVVTQYSDIYKVSGGGGGNNGNKIRVNVNVITHVCNEFNNNFSGFTIHYWNDGGLTGDVVCQALGTTKTKNVGFWNTAQTFKQFYVDVPNTATGFKFHIGDKWFPNGEKVGDGDLTKANTVYVFNYDYDRAVYAKE